MDMVTKKPIYFEHLLDENQVFLIKDVYATKLENENHRSLWNSSLGYRAFQSRLTQCIANSERPFCERTASSIIFSMSQGAMQPPPVPLVDQICSFTMAAIVLSNVLFVQLNRKSLNMM